MIFSLLIFLSGCIASASPSAERAPLAAECLVFNPPPAEEDSAAVQAFFRYTDSTLSYSSAKAAVLKTKSKIDAQTISADSLSALFTELLLHKIIPYWYGTSWDFNGYTAVPNQGVIACGYFVSTTLLHMGINVNRYKLAQQLPIHEAQSIACGTPVLVIENETNEENIAELDSLLTPGVYFLGLAGSHVGFILQHEKGLFVIHSNYIGDSGVTIERIEESQVFNGFRQFYIAEISTNEVLMDKWIKGEVVMVIEE